MKTLGIILFGIANLLGCVKEPEPTPMYEQEKVILRGYAEVLPAEVWFRVEGQSDKDFHIIFNENPYYKEVYVNKIPGKRNTASFAVSNINNILSGDSIYSSIESSADFMENAIRYATMTGSMDVPVHIDIPGAGL
jgi:hypothetical protein